VVQLEAISVGYKGQPVAHPLLVEIRQTHTLIGQLLARLDLSTDEEDGPTTHIMMSSPAPRSVKARDAAQKRWRKH
jgi:hypothetical protein